MRRESARDRDNRLIRERYAAGWTVAKLHRTFRFSRNVIYRVLGPEVRRAETEARKAESFARVARLGPDVLREMRTMRAAGVPTLVVARRLCISERDVHRAMNPTLRHVTGL